MATHLRFRNVLSSLHSKSRSNLVDLFLAASQLTEEEEDALLKESTASFADWIANLIRRVILLLENLPEEDANGSRSGGDEGKSYIGLAVLILIVVLSSGCGLSDGGL